MAEQMLERPEALAIEAMPVLNESDTVLAAFKQMTDSKVGVCVVVTGNSKHWLMKGEWLKKVYLEQRNLLDQDVSQVKLGVVIDAAPGYPMVEGSASQPADDGLQLLGWNINIDSFRATPPPVFLCENGHRNDDPDSGYCRHCPGKIIS